LVQKRLQRGVRPQEKGGGKKWVRITELNSSKRENKASQKGGIVRREKGKTTAGNRQSPICRGPKRKKPGGEHNRPLSKNKTKKEKSKFRATNWK